jgi:ketosteroid isomerase-like protein
VTELDALCDFFERLDRGGLDRLGEHYATDAWFKDPFHEVRGIDRIRAILQHTFDVLPGARFRVTGRFPGKTGQAVILWEMDFVMPLTRKPTTIAGATHLEFDGTGKVRRHRDYWDAAEELYGRLPGLAWLMRALARRMAAPV